MKKNICFAILFFSFLVGIAAVNKGKPMNLSSLVPKEINGWKVIELDRIYNRQTLFEYINGGAEIYLTYRFQEVFVRTFERKNNAPITIEIFDMVKPEEAFGIFTFERESEDIGIGQGSEYSDGLLRFWKNHFFISLLAEEETDSSKTAIMKLAKSIDHALSDSGDLGFYESGQFLPGEGLLREQIRFFHNNFNLNYHYYLADQNILNLDDDTDALLAPYLTGKEKSYLLVVRYPDAKKASFSYAQFIHAYMPEAEDQGTAIMENNKWTAGAVQNELVCIIFDALSKESAQQKVRQVFQNLESKS
jgi:hypothetical protein